MKNIFKIKLFQIVLVASSISLFNSCNESFFDEQAGKRIDPKNHYQSAIDVDISIDGAIIPLQDMMPRMIILDGLRTDMMDVTPRADANMRAINDQVFSMDNPFLNPADFYKVIVNVNEILANIDQVHLLDRNFDKLTLHYKKGALIGLRAWVYFNLVRLYGEAAWITDNVSSLPNGLTQKMLKKEVMIDTLINQVKKYIHDSDAGIQYVEIRTRRYPNTKALLGELYLEKNDYPNAAKYLKMACESYGNTPSMLKINNAYTKEAWKNIFLNAENAWVENIAVVPFASTEGQINPLPEWMLVSNKYMVKPTNVLIDSFKTQTPLQGPVGDFYRGLGVSYDITLAGDAFINKYSIDKGEPFSSDIVLSRAADIHLLLAEAVNRMGDNNTALIILNGGFNAENPKPAPYFMWSTNLGIRGRAFLNNKTVSANIRGTARTEAIEELIINERALELAFEGKRWFDLVRVAKRRGPEFLANRIAAKYSDKAKSDKVKAILMNEANWYLPYK